VELVHTFLNPSIFEQVRAELKNAGSLEERQQCLAYDNPAHIVRCISCLDQQRNELVKFLPMQKLRILLMGISNLVVEVI